MTQTKVYIFSGTFSDVEEACLYSQPQWEPEPDETVSDKEYSDWQVRNPVHRLKENINSYEQPTQIE